jgi:hypothetical protein
MVVLGVTTLRPWLHLSFMQKCKLILLPLKTFAEIESVQIEFYTLYHTSLMKRSRPVHESKAYSKNRRNFYIFPPPQNFFIVKVISRFRKFAEIEDVS